MKPQLRMGHVSLVRQHQECDVAGERRRKEGWGIGGLPKWDGAVLLALQL